MKLTIAITLLYLIAQAATLNILGIFPYEGKSHFNQFKVYLRELAARGHNVTVISYFPEKNPPPNYKDVRIADVEIKQDMVPMQKMSLAALSVGLMLTRFGIENCGNLVESLHVQVILKAKPKFDVVVTELFNSDCALGLAHVLGAPVVGITSHTLMPYHHKRLGIPSNPAYVPFQYLGGGTKPTLYQRVERVIFDVFVNAMYTVGQWYNHYQLSKYYENIPPLEELARDIKVMLLYQHASLTGSRLLPANVIEVGGYHVPKANPLTGELKKFMDEAKHGVVYISFGSMLKCNTLSSPKKQAILDAIKELPQRFIWKWEDDSMELDTDKVFVSKWLPQVDILAHPKTLTYVAHGGLGGIAEAVHYGVPVVVIPFFGDQPSNAAAVQESGFGSLLDLDDLSKETLVAAIRKVLSPKFREKAISVSKAWHDRPLSPMDAAVYWTEYAARNANISLRTAAADTPLYQHWNIDVAVVLLVSAVLSFYVLNLSMVVGAKIFYRFVKTDRRKKQE